MASTYKIVSTKTTVSDAVSSAFGEFQSLRDEMNDWADSMEEKFSQTSRYEAIREAADNLDSFADEETDVPEIIGAEEITVSEQVNRRKNKGPSRAVRKDNAVAALQAAVDLAEEKLSDLEAEKDSAEEEKEDLESEDALDADERKKLEGIVGRLEEIEAESSAIEEMKDELENVIGEAEGIEFPGMYG